MQDAPYRPFGAFRFFLAFCVFTSHAAPLTGLAFLGPLQLGNVGVMTFFVLSGFVIAEALDRFYRDNPAGFLINRGFKIFPPYWAALTLTIVVTLFLSPHPVDPETLLGNYLLIGRMFRIKFDYFYISIAWAVIVELIFYFFAAAFLGMEKLRPLRWPFVAAVVTGYAVVKDPWTYAFGISGALEHAPHFLLGIAMYRLVRAPGAMSQAILLAAAALSIHAYVSYVGRGGDWRATTAIFVCVASAIPYLAGTTIRAGKLRVADIELGLLTYLFYLCHQVFVDTMPGLGFAGTFLVTLASAKLLYLVTEAPLQGLRDAIRGVPLYKH